MEVIWKRKVFVGMVKKRNDDVRNGKSTQDMAEHTGCLHAMAGAMWRTEHGPHLGRVSFSQ